MFNCKIISSKEISSIHNTSLNILKKIGVKVNQGEVLDILGDTGAVVDKNRRVVKLPEDMVMESIQKADKRHILYGRNTHSVAKFGYKGQIFLSSGGQYLWIEEITEKRRPGTIKDSRMAILGRCPQRN